MQETLPIGVMTGIKDNPLKDLARIRELGLEICQLANPPDEYVYGGNSDDMTGQFISAVKETGVSATSVFIMYKGHKWNLTEGPKTIGLIPEKTRATRAVHACAVSNWAKKAGIPVVTSHMGFIPEDENSEEYKGFIETMQALADFFSSNGQTFAFETGQEPPWVLKRTIADIGRDNIGVNLDAANIVMYGMGTPEEALEELGAYVINTHIKDGCPPCEEGLLGPETPLGEGCVDYFSLIPGLYKKGFRGPLTIEREISGDKQMEDIKKAVKILKEIKAGLQTRAKKP